MEVILYGPVMRDQADFKPVLREGAWLAGCIVAAIAFSEFVEDKGNQTLFVSGVLYLLSGVVRFAIGVWRRRR